MGCSAMILSETPLRGPSALISCRVWVRAPCALRTPANCDDQVRSRCALSPGVYPFKLPPQDVALSDDNFYRLPNVVHVSLDVEHSAKSL
jgi:hypothetical protein